MYFIYSTKVFTVGISIYSPSGRSPPEPRTAAIIALRDVTWSLRPLSANECRFCGWRLYCFRSFDRVSLWVWHSSSSTRFKPVTESQLNSIGHCRYCWSIPLVVLPDSHSWRQILFSWDSVGIYWALWILLKHPTCRFPDSSSWKRIYSYDRVWIKIQTIGDFSMMVWIWRAVARSAGERSVSVKSGRGRFSERIECCRNVSNIYRIFRFFKL